MPAPSPNRPHDDELRRLYVDERWTAQQIADLADVRKITALRWLRAAGIERRLPGRPNTLAHRGITPPTAKELIEMVHVRHMGYREIAELYGVDFTAVPHWLDKHEIARPEVWATRRKGHSPVMPTPEEAAARYNAGEPLQSIGASVGVSDRTMRRYLARHGVEIRRDGWDGGKRYACVDGHEARSLYEQRVDDWLHEHGIEHEVEPAYPWDRRYRADFKVGDTYVEVWGVTENDAYKHRRAMKVARCAEAGLPLFQIEHWWLYRSTWRRRLAPLIPASTQQALTLD